MRREVFIPAFLLCGGIAMAQDPVLRRPLNEGSGMIVSQQSQLLLPDGDGNALHILDSSGRIVQEQELNSISTAVDLSPLTAGMYLVCLQGHGARGTQHVLVP